MSAFGTQYVELLVFVEPVRSNTSVRTDASWNLARISTRNKLTDQNPFDSNFTYSYSGSSPGSGVDIYVVDTGSFTFSSRLFHRSI